MVQEKSRSISGVTKLYWTALAASTFFCLGSFLIWTPVGIPLIAMGVGVCAFSAGTELKNSLKNFFSSIYSKLSPKCLSRPQKEKPRWLPDNEFQVRVRTAKQAAKKKAQQEKIEDKKVKKESQGLRIKGSIQKNHSGVEPQVSLLFYSGQRRVREWVQSIHHLSA